MQLVVTQAANSNASMNEFAHSYSLKSLNYKPFEFFFTYTLVCIDMNASCSLSSIDPSLVFSNENGSYNNTTCLSTKQNNEETFISKFQECCSQNMRKFVPQVNIGGPPRCCYARKPFNIKCKVYFADNDHRLST